MINYLNEKEFKYEDNLYKILIDDNNSIKVISLTKNFKSNNINIDILIEELYCDNKCIFEWREDFKNKFAEYFI